MTVIDLTLLIDQWPLWAIIGLVLIPFGGLILTELSRRVKGTPQVSLERQ